MAKARRLSECTPLRAFHLVCAVSVAPRLSERWAIRRKNEPIFRSGSSGTPLFNCPEEEITATHADWKAQFVMSC
jgi:hypothetical protein